MAASETVIVLPDRLWEHRLFQQSARFLGPSAPTVAAHCEAHLRLLRNMPSSSDESRQHILEATAAMLRMGEQWLAVRHRHAGLPPEPSLLQRLKGLCRALDSGVPIESVRPLVERLEPDLPPEHRAYLSLDGGGREAVRVALGTLAFLTLDWTLATDSACRHRYLKRVYRAVDRDLRFNATTDLRRLVSVLGWIRHLLAREGRAGLSYVDVGCAADAGAPSLPLAARILRDPPLCGAIHGTDVVEPRRDVVRGLLRQHRVLLYAADPLRHPLPRRYDAVLLANVHRHLTRPLQERLLSNLGASLNEAGTLFVNWRFEDGANPCVCLRRVGCHMLLAAQANLP